MVYGINNEDSSAALTSSHERLQLFDKTTALQEISDEKTLRLKTMAGVSGQFDDCDDTPREVDLLTEEHVEDLLDAVECLRGKVEQLQIQCEKLSFEKGRLEEQLIQQEKNSLEKVHDYEQEISSLRKLNLQLMADMKNNEDSKSIPSWVKTSLDAEKSQADKAQAEREVKSLQITIMEKDKQISSLEWQLMDAESTASSIQAERDRLAVEIDCMLAREEEDLANYRALPDDRGVFSDDEYYQPNPSNAHNKHTRRHLSDLTKREDSHIDDLTGFVQKGKRVTTLSDNDVPSAAEAQFLGGLKRTTNFNNINDVDEFVDFHQDKRVGDSSSIDFTASFPPLKARTFAESSWHSFGSDSEGPAMPSKVDTSSQKIVNDSSVWALSDSKHQNVEGCFDDAGEDDWTLDADPSPAGALGNYKNESCRSSSSAYFSDNSANEVCHDPWAFAPDSIIDVSTGEELKSPLPESKKSTAENDSLKQDKESDLLANQNKNSLIHSADISAAFSANFERSSSVRSDGAVESLSKDSVIHQRISSEPAPPTQRRKSSEDHKGVVKLEAYQKWRLNGRKGQPPAKLKISQC